MSGCSRNPGPLCQLERPVVIDSGTSCLMESPSPTSQLDLFMTSETADSVRTLEKQWQCDDDVRSEIVRVARKYIGSLKSREGRRGQMRQVCR
jgi:hypothetical protein